MTKNALISVWDKKGIIELAEEFEKKSVNIIATGTTCKFLRKRGFNPVEVSEITDFPEILNGRVKTLNPKIFGGILFKRDNQKHNNEVQKHEIPSIDYIVCNLYPFEKVLWENLKEEELDEYIDIGGVSLLRAAAKANIPVLSDIEQYREFIYKINEDNIDNEYIKKLKAFAFIKTASYDFAISRYYASKLPGINMDMSFKGERLLRYGENPHQKAWFFRDVHAPYALSDAEVLQGKKISYNNYLDMEGAISTIKDFNDEKCCVVLKHGNACGLAVGDNNTEIYKRALAGDPLSAFGGIVCFNYKVDKETALEVKKHFFEIIIAPEFDGEALDILGKKKNLRLVLYKNFASREKYTFMPVEGGILYQEKDWWKDISDEIETVTENKPDNKDIKELEFAFKAVKNIKSNAIVVSSGKTLLGMGAGQPSRVDAVEIALKKAGEQKKGSYLASDAFFPFPDAVEKACEAGIKAIIQPGGSKNDKKVIEKADELGLIMIMTGKRHFRH
ncbi:MAG: bifunctional phosphoribosylaminoimidazolecarboxamide formyltransferase/IMP cyclohydrolase [Candidatus Muiribacteriota bacterium]